jgi:cystathionine beta-lyase
MDYRLDVTIQRRGTDSAKWNEYGADILPLTGAELEFRVPEPILAALRKRLDHPLFGYHHEPPELREAIGDYLLRHFDWRVSPEALVFFPGVVAGLDTVCRALASPGDGVLVQPPVYTETLRTPVRAGLVLRQAPLQQMPGSGYAIDFDAFSTASEAGARLFMLCNPHNPVGRVFRRDELEQMAEICSRQDVIICADEIYADWTYNGRRHLPIAALSPQVADRTITLMGTSKSHNIPGIRLGVAIVQNKMLREKLLAARPRDAVQINTLAYAAALAAYRHADSWQKQVLDYLQTNRDLVCDFVGDRLEGIEMTQPEGTPVAWLDCTRAGLGKDPARFFLEKAHVALNDGSAYGSGGEGFVRLAFGCPRSMLLQGLERMGAALEDR